MQQVELAFTLYFIQLKAITKETGYFICNDVPIALQNRFRHMIATLGPYSGYIYIEVSKDIMAEKYDFK